MYLGLRQGDHIGTERKVGERATDFPELNLALNRLGLVTLIAGINSAS